MGYIDRVLQEGDTVRHVATISRITYLPGILMWVLAGILFALLPQSPTLRALVVAVAVVAFVIGAVFLIRSWWRRFTTEIAVTNRRIIFKHGFVRRYSVEMH